MILSIVDRGADIACCSLAALRRATATSHSSSGRGGGLVPDTVSSTTPQAPAASTNPGLSQSHSGPQVQTAMRNAGMQEWPRVGLRTHAARPRGPEKATGTSALLWHCGRRSVDEDTAECGGGFSRSAGLSASRPGLLYVVVGQATPRGRGHRVMHLVLGSYDGSLVGLQVAAAQVCDSVQLPLAPLHARH